MNTKNNQRARGTKESIIRAVFETMVLEKKPVGKITVREICEKADINRSTFYAHFLDVYDVMEQVENRMAQGLTESFLRKLEEGKGLKTCFIALFEYVREYQGFYAIYFNETHRAGVIGIAWDLLRDRVKNLSYRDFGYENEEEMKYHGEFFISGLTAMLRHWVSRKCAESPEEMFAMLVRQHSMQYSLSLIQDELK